MAERTNKLKVEGLPVNITKDQLTLILKNKRRKGGGPVKDVELTKCDGNCHAVVTFEESEAVDLILSRGDEVEISGVQAKVHALFDSESESKSDENEQKKTESGYTEHKGKRKSKAKKAAATFINTEWDDESQNIHETNVDHKEKVQCRTNKGISTLDNSGSDEESPMAECGAQKAKKKRHRKRKSHARVNQNKPSSQTKQPHPVFPSSLTKQPHPVFSDGDDEIREEAWETTIKVKVKDISKPKDSYILLFEDPSGESELDEESIMLDGLNKNIYVTFDSRKAALDACRLKNLHDSNISKVEMATETDFKTWPNLMSLHGHYFDTSEQKRALEEFVREKTGLDVDHIILGDEARSAVIVFNPDTCDDICKATWQCAGRYRTSVRLITAPVFKSYSVKVTGINPNTSDFILQCYMANKKRSGGGKVKSTQRYNETEAVITLEEEEGYIGILQKEHHALEGFQLYISPFYPCLSVETYQRYIEPSYEQWEWCETAQLFSDHPYPSQGPPAGVHARERPPHFQSFHHHVRFNILSKLYSANSVHLRKKVIQGTLKLIRFGFEFLTRHGEDLDKLLKAVHCTYALSPMKVFSYLNLKLDWPERLPAAQVKEKLWVGVKETKKYLDQFNFVEFELHESHTHAFQRYCQEKRQQELQEIDIFFDHSVSVGVAISCCNVEQIKSIICDLHSRFLSDAGLSVPGKADDFYTVKQEIRENLGKDQWRHTATQIREYDHSGGQSTLLRTHFQPLGTDIGQQNDKAQRQANTVTGDAGEIEVDGVPLQEELGSQVQEEDREALEEDYMVGEEEEKCPRTEEESLAEKDLILLQRTEFQKFLDEKDVKARVVLDAERSCAVITAENGNEILNARYQLMKRLRDFKVTEFSEFSQQQRDLLSQEATQEKINRLFVEEKLEAWLICTEDKLMVYHTVGTDERKLKETMLSQVMAKEKTIDLDQLVILQSEKGCKFLSNLCESSDTLRVSPYVKLQPSKLCLLIIAPTTQQDIIDMEVNTFLQTNKQYKQEIAVHHEKLVFVKRFLSNELQEIKTSLAEQGTTVKQEQGKFVLQGLKDGVASGQNKLTQLSEKIISRNVQIKIFGIKEFLHEAEGKSMIQRVEETQGCLIVERADSHSGPDLAQTSTLTARDNDEYTFSPLRLDGDSFTRSYSPQRLPSRPYQQLPEFLDLSPSIRGPSPPRFFGGFPSRSFATASPQSKKKLQVHLVQGGITMQKTDVIVISANASLDLSQGPMGQAVLKYGGTSVQDELRLKYNDVIKTGTFAESSGGNLKCRHIFHAFVATWKGSQESEMKELILKILKRAMQLKASSIAIPALGTGNLHYPADVSARAVTDAIKKFESRNPHTSLKEVYIVVLPKDGNVEQAFQSVLPRSHNSSSDDSDRDSDGYGSSSDSNDDDTDEDSHDSDDCQGGHGKMRFKYGSVRLTLKKGDIADEKCDAIVSGIKASMDLSNSGAVCKVLKQKCGAALQSECSSKKDEIIQKGYVMTTAPNLNYGGIFFVHVDNFSQTLDQCILQVLTEAENQGFTSIALPTLGCGAGWDLQRIKKMIFSGVEQFGTSGRHSLRDVRLVIFSQDILDKFVAQDFQFGQTVFQQSPVRRKKSVPSPGAQPLAFMPVQPTRQPRGQRGRLVHAASDYQLFHKSPPVQQQIPLRTSAPQKQYPYPPSLPVSISDHVGLRIYSDSVDKIEAAKSELGVAVRKWYKEDKEDDKEIKNLNKLQVRELQEVGLKHYMHVAVDVQKGMLVIKGFKPDGILHVHKKLRQMLLSIKDQHQRSLHQKIKVAFQWQYEQGGSWRDFDPLANIQIENAKKSNSCEITAANGCKYYIDLTNMAEYQVDANGLKSGQGQNIRRRDLTKGGEPLPQEWSSMSESQNLLVVQLQPGSPEFIGVEQNFRAGGASLPIKKIERIQNKALYQQYAVKKREIDGRNPKGHQNEKILFHGTTAKTVQLINENGFNRSYCGVNATAYGDGVYFALRSQYSVNYAKPDASGTRLMYQVRVLVGESTNSRKGMKYLPMKTGTIPYDSGTDGRNVMYIIFHDCQAYPEYLITF